MALQMLPWKSLSKAGPPPVSFFSYRIYCIKTPWAKCAAAFLQAGKGMLLGASVPTGCTAWEGHRGQPAQALP